METLNTNLPIETRTFASLLDDAGFKAVMADQVYKPLLIGLLNEVLPPHDRIADIVQYLDREQGLDTVNSKKTVLDLVCLTDDGRTIDIEIQRKKDAYFFQRCFYYAAGFYHRKLSKGDNMMQEESSKIFAPTTIICIFAQSLTYWI